MKCKICKMSFENKRSFATHLQTKHKITSKEYTIKYLSKKNAHLCNICKKETRYVSFAFKEYCKKHGNHAERIGGKKGGKARAWSKGLTKETDSRLARQSKKVSGSGNHFYGKRHTQKTINKIKIAKLVSRSVFAKQILLRDTEFELLTSYEDYFSRQEQSLHWDEKYTQMFDATSPEEIKFPIYIYIYIRSSITGN